MEHDNSVNMEYADFLNCFIKQGYQFVAFDKVSKTKNQVILRHDIDFDCELAYKNAVIENKLNIHSTYFFLLASDSYNLLSNAKYIKEIINLGHSVSIHFDPLIYDDYEHGLILEKDIFERIFNQKVSIISLHRPNIFFQDYNKPIQNIEHTYLSKYFKDIKYFSDSTGVWRFGNPIHSKEFSENKTLQVLTHPVWWHTKGKNNSERIENNFLKKVTELKNHYTANCKPFSKNSNEL